MIITLPYPPKELMPNRKNGKNWKSTHQIKKDSCNTAYFLTKTIKDIHLVKFDGLIALTITFAQIGKRNRDLDGLLSASKNMLDGVAKALGIDDSQFEPITIKRAYIKGESATIIEIED